MNFSNGAYSGRTLLSWNLVKGSSYNATVVLSKIRCIKDKHHMQSKYVTWYGHHHLVLLISISKASSWSPSSPARHHDLHHLDLHQRVVTWSSRQLLLLQLLLTHSDKVKQLHGACISYNKETTIWLLPAVNIYYKTWSSHTTTYITSCLDHITSQHTLQKQVRRPLLCCCKFYVAATGFKQEPFLPTEKTTTTVNYQVCCFNFLQGPAVVKFDSTKVGETDTRQPPLCKTSCTSVGGTGLMYVDM